MSWLITLLVIAAVAALVVTGLRTFRPEIERARRIRRAERNSRIER